MTKHYLGVTEVAELLGIHASDVSAYKMPVPDVTVGRARGWRRETIEEWNASRPGHGGNPDWVKQTAHQNTR